MSLSKSVLKATPHRITYLLTEAGDAAGELAIDVAADCVAGGLKDLLTPDDGVADAEAARDLIHENCTVSVMARSLTPDGSTEGPALQLDFDDDGSDGFEMNATALKAATADAAVWVVTIAFNHSLTS